MNMKDNMKKGAQQHQQHSEQHRKQSKKERAGALTQESQQTPQQKPTTKGTSGYHRSKMRSVSINMKPEELELFESIRARMDNMPGVSTPNRSVIGRAAVQALANMEDAQIREAINQIDEPKIGRPTEDDND